MNMSPEMTQRGRKLEPRGSGPVRQLGHPQDCHVETLAEEREAVSWKAIRCPGVRQYEAPTILAGGSATR